MAEESSFDELLDRLRSGDDDAARQIFEQYARRLIGLARTHLDGAVRRRVDPEDVVQSVFKSFFVRVGKGDFDLENKDNLWSLLVVITLHKCGHKVRDLRSQRRDIRREADLKRGGDDSAASWQALAPGPTPLEAAVMAETVEQVFASLKDRERQIVELHLAGHEIAEIQVQVQRTEWTVRDVLKRVRRRLERLLEEADA
jgi:RNA polymerase sigma-70 factor, ECF subfamily